jgi:hypothetical protein
MPAMLQPILALTEACQPDCRVHGVVEGCDWVPNRGIFCLSVYLAIIYISLWLVIPDYAKMNWNIRAPSWAKVQKLQGRVMNCLEYVPIPPCGSWTKHVPLTELLLWPRRVTWN